MRQIITLFLLFVVVISAHAQRVKREKVNVKPVEEWRSFMVPGIGYSTYIPHAMDTLGVFHGPMTEFVFFTSAAPAYKGPSHFRTYGRLSIMRSSNKEIRQLFAYSIGGNFSFEREVHRKAAIPYFGLEMGGLHQKDVGGTFQITPVLGLHILSTQHITWYAQGGYTYAVSHFEDLSGAFITMGFNVQFW